MDAVIREKMEKVLQGKLRYTSGNLAFNMQISKLQKRVQADSESMDSCIEELDQFLAKYPIVAKVDLANIAAL